MDKIPDQTQKDLPLSRTRRYGNILSNVVLAVGIVLCVSGFIALFALFALSYTLYALDTGYETSIGLIFVGSAITVCGSFLKFIFSQIDVYLKTDASSAEKLPIKTIIHGTLVATACAISGGVLISMGHETAQEGVTMFWVLPFATGFVTAFTVPYWRAVGLSLQIAMSIAFAVLLVIGIEGIFCVVMALPLIFIAIMLGAGIGLFVKWCVKRRSDSNLSMIFVPVLAGVTVFGAGKVEDQLYTGARTECVESSIVIDASADEVWRELLKFDQVTGPQPLLMQLGLPVPESCTMSGSGVGAERTCHFDSGFIRERVTRWQPPEHLEFSVEEVQLPGRHWLGFEGATYTLDRIDDGKTRVTRTTTVTSTLRPAIYWRVFERLGTRTEHDYILASLKSKLATHEKE